MRHCLFALSNAAELGYGFVLRGFLKSSDKTKLLRAINTDITRVLRTDVDLPVVTPIAGRPQRFMFTQSMQTFPIISALCSYDPSRNRVFLRYRNIKRFRSMDRKQMF